jgi:type III pantothenate kinase
VQGALATAEPERLIEVAARAGSVDRIVAANVAGAAVGRTIRQTLGSDPTWVRACAEQCGVRSGYADPAQLGADRWAALIAARDIAGAACVVVNAGTTMTVDALSADFIFLGGFIVAGFDLMREAVTRNTAQLELESGSFAFFPDNTADAIVTGAINALAGAVDRMVAYMRRTGEDEPLVLVSGGNAQRLLTHLDERARAVDNLVLEGVVRIGLADG